MAVSQIDGGRQIKATTITNNEISASANIALSKLAEAVIQADGGQAFTADQPLGGFKITSLGTGTADTDAATVGQMNALLNGFDIKASVRIATTGAETYTISGGAVTQIAGTSVDGQTTAVGNRILIKNAPNTSGAGVADSNGVGSSQPANGVYRVTNATTNTTVTRDTDADASAEVTAGLTVWTTEGTALADTQWTLTTNDTITLNTTALQFTNIPATTLTFSGGLTKTGNSVTRDALTGDVTTSANAATIANNAVSFAKMADLAANSVIGNLTGGATDPVAVPTTNAATASTVVARDANANAVFNNLIENLQSVASAAGTTTLTVGSPCVTVITGSTTQTVVMPAATTLAVGQDFIVINRSSGIVTVNMNGGSLLQTMASGSFLTARVLTVGTSAGTWDAAYTSAGGSGSVTTVSVATANGFQGSVSNPSTTPAITVQTSLAAGVIKSNGSNAIALATAGTDYLAPSSRVTRETPAGTVNGSNTAFTLANTPIVGTEEVYLNGLLQEPGGGNDYTISGTTITYLTAPVTGDKLRVSYFK